MNGKVFFKRAALVCLATSLMTPLLRAADGDNGSVTLRQMDQECEQARDNALRPIRARYVEECVQNGDKDRPTCERFYADYGDAILPAGKKFYDLPECVKAFEFRRSSRSAD